jgi:hypothetical protein
LIFSTEVKMGLQLIDGIAPGTWKDGVYAPLIDWNMMVGARISEARIQQLQKFDFESVMDLSVDDIFACNNRKAQALEWSFGLALEKVLGVETANKIYYEVGYTAGHKGWAGICDHFKTDKITPMMNAWYQDMAHLFYGPHTQCWCEYTETLCVVTRQDCFVSYPPPGMEAMNKYTKPFSEGYLQAYMDMAPYMECIDLNFITEDQMLYKADLKKYSAFNVGKRAGQPFHQLIFKWTLKDGEIDWSPKKNATLLCNKAGESLDYDLYK